MKRAISRLVKQRAQHACEYCGLPANHVPLLFHIDHILADQHGGETTPANLAYSCSTCNSHKGTNFAGVDPLTKKKTRLFNPRRDRWTRHFKLDGAFIVGITPVGRTTVRTLAMNLPLSLEVRRDLIVEGQYPLASPTRDS